MVGSCFSGSEVVGFNNSGFDVVISISPFDVDFDNSGSLVVGSIISGFDVVDSGSFCSEVVDSISDS